MGRTSHARRLLDESNSPDEEGTWIVVYDFRDRKPNPRFWTNLQRIKESSRCHSIQYSVVIARSRSAAAAVARLATHYGAEVVVFVGEVVSSMETVVLTTVIPSETKR